MRKLTWILALVVLTVTGFSPRASAFFESYESFYTTGSPGDFTPKNQFSINEKPWLYIKFQDDSHLLTGPSQTFAVWNWTNPDPSGSNDSNLLDSGIVTDSNNFWISFTDDSWDSIKKQGNWDIYAFSLYNEGGQTLNDGQGTFHTFAGTTDFRLTSAPEPVSSILFLTGGAAFAGNLLRRRRKTV